MTAFGYLSSMLYAINSVFGRTAQLSHQIQLKRFLSLAKPNAVRDKHKVPAYKSESLTNLSGVTSEDLLQDFIDQYEIQVFKRPRVQSE
jgi:hypothetical protein